MIIMSAWPRRRETGQARAEGDRTLKSPRPARLFRSAGRRSALLAACVAILFAALGTVRAFVPAALLAESPFDLDLALRTMSLGWFEPRHATPVAIVDIDAATHRGWGSPAVTPRDAIASLLQVTTGAQPIAVVVDIDLSWGDDDAVQGDGERRLAEFLRQYRGVAPIIFPKRVEPAPDGTLRAARSPYDTILAGNSQLAWAHASFQTDGGGAVRDWAPWLPVCDERGPAWLPSVTMRIAAMAPELPAGLERPTPPAPLENCVDGREPPTERLLVGPRLTGQARPVLMPMTSVVSAEMLLAPGMEIDGATLFGGRVVFIGATYPNSGDFWLTPSGVLPGVELLANTVRHAPLRTQAGLAAEIGYRLNALVLFAVFAAAAWWLRGLVAVTAIMLFALVYVSTAIGLFDHYAVFDALEAAIVLTIVYKALEVVVESVVDWRNMRGDHPRGPRGWWQTLKAACVRQD